MDQEKIKELKTFSFGNVTINVLKPDIGKSRRKYIEIFKKVSSGKDVLDI